MGKNVWTWFIEYTHPTQAHMHGISHYIYNGKTQYQQVEIAETELFGRCLILDGKIQSTQLDEYIYHEALVHPALVVHPAPRNIMVAGGGEGAVLREILKHPGIEKITMVDIDQEVVKLCRQYLPTWNDGSYDDPRVEIVFYDARKFLLEKSCLYDVIILDLPEPLAGGPCALLYTREFYSLLAQRLQPGGAVALQADNLNPAFMYTHSAIYNTIRTVFDHVISYGAYIPSYDTHWGFIHASPDRSLNSSEPKAIDSTLAQRGIDNLQFYDGLTHRHMLAQPLYIRRVLQREKRIITDQNPFYTYG